MRAVPLVTCQENTPNEQAAVAILAGPKPPELARPRTGAFFPPPCSVVPARFGPRASMLKARLFFRGCPLDLPSIVHDAVEFRVGTYPMASSVRAIASESTHPSLPMHLPKKGGEFRPHVIRSCRRRTYSRTPARPQVPYWLFEEERDDVFGWTLQTRAAEINRARCRVTTRTDWG